MAAKQQKEADEQRYTAEEKALKQAEADTVSTIQFDFFYHNHGWIVLVYIYLSFNFIYAKEFNAFDSHGISNINLRQRAQLAAIEAKQKELEAADAEIKLE